MAEINQEYFRKTRQRYHQKRKLQTKISYEYRHKSLIKYKETESSNKEKGFYTMTNRFIPGIQGWLNIQKLINVIHHMNRTKKHGYLNRCRKKHLTKSNTHDLKKHPNKLGAEGKFFNLIKYIYEKFIANPILSGRRLKLSS